MRLLSALAAVCLLAFAPCALAQTTDVAGLWAYHTSFPVGPAGELSIERHGATWRASIAGQSAEATQTGNVVRIAFPDGSGFRGTLETNGRTLRGFWVRAIDASDPYYPQTFAAPVHLRSAGRDRWRGDVHPIPTTFTLDLSIFRDPTGALKAAFRNPEFNRHGPAMQLAVTRDADALRFSADPRQSEDTLDAVVKHDPERIEMVWGDLNRTIALERATPEAAARYSARAPGSPPYVYRTPPATGDGWRVARAGDLGMDEAALARAVQRIIDVDPTAARPWLIHSMAIAYRGRLVLDEYFYGYDRDEPHDTRSAAKTFSSVMLGALIMEGRDISPQTPLYTLLAPMGPFANPDPRKAQITLAHMMTHTSGLACNDNDDASPGNEGAMQTQTAQPNWWKFTLDLPMAYDPGARYAYCSANINLVGAALTQASGEWLPALFDRIIARPLQFGRYSWNLIPNGEGYLGGGVLVRTRDLLKLGQTFLDGGVWNGHRIVTQAWVRESLAPHARISPATTGLEGQAFQNVYWEADEGYAWHLLSVRSGDQTYPAYYANGNGGQLLIVVPEFQLAVMFTAGNYGQGVWNQERDAIVGGMIIPAIRH